LRQICDSPALLKDRAGAGTLVGEDLAGGVRPVRVRLQAGGGYPNVSAKLEELIREIEENAGHHKALVFFTVHVHAAT